MGTKQSHLLSGKAGFPECDLSGRIVRPKGRTTNFVISSRVAKSPRLNLRNRGLGVRASPDVLERHWETSAFRISWDE